MILWGMEEKSFHLVSILQLWHHFGLISVQKVTVMASSLQNFTMKYLITTLSGVFLVTNWLAGPQRTTDVERRWFLFFLPILFKTHVISFGGRFWFFKSVINVVRVVIMKWMEMISQLFCLKGKIKKEHFNDHPRQASIAGPCNGLFCFLLRSRLLFEILAPGVVIISYQKSSSQGYHEELDEVFTNGHQCASCSHWLFHLRPTFFLGELSL